MDGNKQKHDSVRKYKNNGEGTFDTIIENIKKIHDTLEDTLIRVRVNFDLKTLDKIDEIFSKLETLNKKKIYISFHKVWQINDPLDSDKIIYAINSLLDKGYIVEYNIMGRQHLSCYADMYNEAVINYDGHVFKCTSRDFLPESSDGLLLNDGSIDWKYEKVSNRLNTEPIDECKECSLFPACTANCSQNLLENKAHCWVKDIDIPFEDYMAYNFKRNINSKKLANAQ